MGKLLNFVLDGTLMETAYHARRGRGNGKYPQRDNPERHAAMLQEQYVAATREARRTFTKDQVAAIKTKDGCYFDISGLANKDLDIKSLEDRRIGIRLCNVRETRNDGQTETIATIFIPNSSEAKFLSKIQEYAKGTPEGKKNPKNNDLIRSIEKISMAVVRSLWTDNDDLFPQDKIWCEIWLQSDVYSRERACKSFANLCMQLEIQLKQEVITFPERVVFLALVGEPEIEKLLMYCPTLSELRKAPEPNSFFLDLKPCEQREWAQDLLDRLDMEDTDISVCLLDTGLNDGHPLLKPLIMDNGVNKAKPDMRTAADRDGHGTGMAGIAAYGDLQLRLSSHERLAVQHKIESVKLLDSDSPNKPELYGEFTKQAISEAEIANAHVNRSFCMAITANQTGKDPGRPSAWSAAIDEEAAGVADRHKRLILISAGDVQPSEYAGLEYPETCRLHPVEDPAQAWNAITVGAYTDKISIDDKDFKDWHPVAESQNLSPFSATSALWDKRWPIKPEILCEGGNLARCEENYDTPNCLQILTTNYHPEIRLFTSTNATSAATAYASWMSAQLMAQYPTLWPETIRALIVASARWPENMFNTFCQNYRNKSEIKKLLQICGYGIADLNRAQFCKENAVNMIIEGEIQPFKSKEDGSVVFNQMHIHELPWPKEYLLSMDTANVEMRVVLSYFIEPSPGEKGWDNKYRYSSCGLRFDVNNPEEKTKEQFEYRISREMNSETEVDIIDNDTNRWVIGAQNRSLGSVHCDIWKGSAAQLSESNLVAIYPTTGWWKVRKHLGKYNDKLRYSLVVTLSTPVVDAQLYTKIESIIKTPVAVPITRRYTKR